ncbi:MAG: hypothetical protein IT356_02390 [Gemmatimonadaceae bacterium]|nr:hypothetical protein [Gemmatimonadaceae bacterium]
MTALAIVLGVALGAGARGPAALSAQARSTVPAPESVFGFAVGADSQLFDYEQSMSYFRKLAAASNRVRIVEVGKTSFGRTMSIVVISSPQNLAKLDRLRQINQRLAHPEGLTDSEARALAREGRAFVDISGGLHASEIAGSQHTPKLAYDILSRASEPEVAQILDNVVFVLWPSINPDGQDIVVNWCRDQYAGRNSGQMELYQKYIGHDNNRDSYMMNVVESRVIQRTWRDWEPNIIYVHHQTSPEPTRIWIPPFADPVGQRAPAIPARTINSIGTYIAQELDAHGQPGAAHMLSTFDAWYPGYVDYMPVYQNIPSWWTETQGGNCATPKPVGRPENFPADYKDLRPQALYLSPWAGGPWRLVDAVDYMVTASRATLKFAAKFREEILYNRYQSGRNVIQKYRTSAPYAYIVPQNQHDAMAPVELLRRLAFMGVRVDQLDRDAAYAGTTYPRGTWVVPLDQEFGELAREILEVQHYPEMGDDLPYDAAGWTLPYQMGVNVVEAEQPLPAEFRTAMKAVRGTPEPWGKSADYPFTTNAVAAGIVTSAPGTVAGAGNYILVNPAENNGFRFVTKALGAGASLTYAPDAPGGARWVVTGLAAATASEWARELSVHLERAASVPGTQKPTTRVGLYKASPGNMDEGWTEWLMDTHGVTYSLIEPAEMQSGSLGSKYDVIVTGSQSFGAGGFGGRGGGFGGAGGRGGRGGGAVDSTAIRAAEARTQAVDAFVNAGGTVVAWNQGATAAATSLKLPVKNAVAGLPRTEFFTGSSLMRIAVDSTHPVMSGMPGLSDVMVSNSPVFETTDGFSGAVIAKFTDAPLRSGYLDGAKYIQNQAAALDVKHGNGHVVLFGFSPQWRGQPTGSFRMVFNSLFFGGEVSAAAKATPGFFVPKPVP